MMDVLYIEGSSVKMFKLEISVNRLNLRETSGYPELHDSKIQNRLASFSCKLINIHDFRCFTTRKRGEDVWKWNSGVSNYVVFPCDQTIDLLGRKFVEMVQTKKNSVWSLTENDNGVINRPAGCEYWIRYRFNVRNTLVYYYCITIDKSTNNSSFHLKYTHFVMD